MTDTAHRVLIGEGAGGGRDANRRADAVRSPTEAELYIELGEMGRLELADLLVPVYTHGIGVLDARHF